MAENNTLTIGFVGVGNWGKKLLAEFASQTNVAYVLHRGNPDTIALLAKDYPNTTATDSYENIVNDSTVDAIVIASPTQTHFDFAKQALTAGKHVFVEKPGTGSLKNLQTLSDLAQQNNRLLAIGYEFAHHAAVQKIREHIKTNPITKLEFSWIKWGTFTDHAIPHLLSHELSICYALGLNDLQVEQCAVEGVESESDIIHCILRNGKIPITMHINRASKEPKSKRVTIHTATGGLLWYNNTLAKFSQNVPGELTPIDLEDASAVTREIKNFCESITKNKPPLTSGEFGLEIWSMIDQIMHVASS